MADFVISNLAGGLNEDPAISIPEDQCAVARNVEYVESPCGERRQGSEEIDLTGSPLEECDRVVWMHRHLPTTNQAESQLWGLGIIDDTGSGDPAAVLAYKDTTWHTVTMDDALVIDGVSEYQIHGQTLHGKLFIAYKSAVNRLHVFVNGVLRRAGLAEAEAPEVEDDGTGTFEGTRYYRVRFAEIDEDTGEVLRLGEPSESVEFEPSGSGEAAEIAIPELLGEGENYWIVEASLDGETFRELEALPISTPTYLDDQDFATGYVSAFPAAEPIGAYTLIPSAKRLTVDEDRLIFGGNFEDPADASSIGWSPVFGDPGYGNDERMDLATEPTKGLDNFDGGELTGLSRVVNGNAYATKFRAIFQIQRSGVRTRAYDAFKITDKRGAIEGSLVEYVDQHGQPILFALDPDIGPIRISASKSETCGRDLIKTWKTINLNATVAARAVTYPEKQQVHWFIATSGSDTPNLRIVLHVNRMRQTEDGSRKGWSIWNGPSANALAACLYAANVNEAAPRGLELKPLIAVEGDGLIWQTDVGDDDNGTEYQACIKTKVLTRRNGLHQFGIAAAVLHGKAEEDATFTVRMLGNRADVGTVQHEADIDLTPSASEGDDVIRALDDFSMSELHSVQIEIVDRDTPGARWRLDYLALRDSSEQQS